MRTTKLWSHCLFATESSSQHNLVQVCQPCGYSKIIDESIYRQIEIHQRNVSIAITSQYHSNVRLSACLLAAAKIVHQTDGDIDADEIDTHDTATSLHITSNSSRIGTEWNETV